MIKIDKGIPLPDNISDYARTLTQMEVGDSFLITTITSSQRSMLYRKMKQHGKKFVSRAVVGGLRVWRLA